MNKWLYNNFLKVTTISFLMIIIGASSLYAQDPFIPKYDAVKRSERCFTITLDENNQFGAVWFRNKGNFNNDTTLYFVVYMGDKDSKGADGLAFVMHDDPRDTIVDTNQTVDIGGGGTFDLEAATGDDGGGLGYAMHESRVNNNDIPGPYGDKRENHRIQPSVAIEFDTWDNGDVQDGKNGNNQPKSPYKGWDHTAVVYNGDVYNEQQDIIDENGDTSKILPLLPISKWGNNKNVEDNNCYAYKIDWKVNNDGTQSLEMWADNYVEGVDAEDFNYSLVMSHTDSMLSKIFNGVTNLRFGFTGSTGGSKNEQTICLLGGNTKPVAGDDFASTEVNTPVSVNVEDNDIDFDGDNLFVPIIIKQPDNGTATVVSQSGVNFISYTPNTNFTGTDTITYKTCDVDSDKCYALCDNADVVVTVGCGDINIGASEIAPNTLCVDTLPANGAAEAAFVSGSIRGTLWQETFNNLEGATSDNGTSAWSVSDGGGCNSNAEIEVESARFKARRTGCEVIWESEVIDISNAYDISISTFLRAEGSMEDADYLEAYYIVDGGAEIPLTNGIHVNNFGSATATASGINEDSTNSTIQIRIYARNSGGGEYYYWDDVRVEAIGPVSPPNLTYNWFDGVPGTIGVSNIGTGLTMSGLRDTTYYVVGVDPNTGCTSDTVSVDITSDPALIDSVAVEELSPLTKCDLPFDGELQANVVIDGDSLVSAGYTFEWWEIDNFNPNGTPLRVGDIASNLEAKTYVVLATHQATGCQELQEGVVSNAQASPSVTAHLISDIVNCVDPTGSLRATATKDGNPFTNNVTFKWYIGSVAPSNQPPDFVGDTISGLAEGTYSVRAIDDISGCESSSANIDIDDLREFPDPVVTGTTDQISCDPNAPTGSFTSAVDEGGGSLTTSGYTFNWYKGLNDVTPARPGYTEGADVDSLEADQYRLIVTDDATECSGTIDTLITENLVTPIIDNTNKSDVTICGPGPNGTITITPQGDPGAFRYRVYDGNGIVPSNLRIDTTSNFIDSLAAGNYTVSIVDTLTECESAPEFISIDDVTTVPGADFDLFPQISCDPANPTGRITANVTVGTAADYTFEWFENTTSGNPVTSTRGINDEIADTLAASTYAVRITDDNTLCQNTYFQDVLTNITLPVIDTAYAEASTFCGTAANGALHATADGGQKDPDIFSFNWTDVATSTFVTDTADVDNVAPGDYELVLVNDTTTCASNPVQITVIDSTVIPDPALTEFNNSSCDPLNPNGKIRVDSIPNETYLMDDYSFEWFAGSTSNPPVLSSEDSIYNVAEGTYAVRVINTITTCQNDVLGTIIDINIQPMINTVNVIQDALYCADPYQSHIEVTDVQLADGSPMNPSDFTYDWVNLDTGDTLSTSGPVLINDTAGGDAVPAGNYRVFGYNGFGCQSDPVDFEVKDVRVLPDFTITSYNNTSCDNAVANGAVTAISKSGTPNDGLAYNYVWEDVSSGSNLFDTTYLDKGQRLNSLESGDYKVTITDTASMCAIDYFASINDTPDSGPIIDLIRKGDITVCTPPNGELEYEVSPFETLPYNSSLNRTYTFYYSDDPAIDTTNFAGSASTTPTNPGEDSVQFAGLGVDTYYAIVRDEYTRCVSPVIQTELVQRDSIDIEIITDNPPASCIGNDGILTITANSPNNGGNGYDITLFYHGKNYNDTTQINQVAPVTSLNQTGLQAGFYSTEVVDIGTGCVSSTVGNLEPTQPPITRIDNSTPSTNCTPGNGTIDFTLLDQGTGNPSDYIVHLYEGNLPLIPNRIDSIQGVDPWAYNGTFTSLEEGEYYIITRSTIDGCFSNDTTVNIEFNGPEPEFALTQAADSTCTGAPSGQGSLSISILNNPDTDYEYTWYTQADTIPGNDFSGPGVSTSENNLFSGMYSVRVLDNDGVNGGLGCRYLVNKQVKSHIKTMELQLSAEPVDSCSSNSGAVLVDDILEDLKPRLSDFTYGMALYDEANTVQVDTASGSSPVRFIHRGDSTFLVKATNMTTNCRSNPFPIQVTDGTNDPGVDLDIVSPDFLCGDPAALTATGEIHASTASGSTNSSEYLFEWYSGNTSGLLPAPQYTAGTDPHIARQLSGGYYIDQDSQSDSLYTVVIEDTDGVNHGCVSQRSISLPYRPSTVKIFNTDIDKTDQTICAPNGTLTINEVNEDFGGLFSTSANPSYVGSYTFELLDEDLNLLADTITRSTGFIDTLATGTYYVRAANEQTDCAYGPPTQVFIKDVSNDPIVSIDMENPDFSCTGGTPTGILSTSVVGGTDNDNTPGNFSYTWTDLAGNPVTTDAGSPPQAIDLPAGDYRLIVEDQDGVDEFCTRTTEFTVTKGEQEIVIVQTDKTDQTHCDANGTLEVQGIRVNGVVISPLDPEFSDYSIDMFVGNPNTVFIPGGGGNGLPGDPYLGIEANTYYAIATNNTTNCRSIPRQEIVNDDTRDPIVAVTEDQVNFSLNYDNPNSQTGIITVEAFEADGSTQGTAGYTYNWYRNEVNNPDSLVANFSGDTDSHSVTNLRDATYFFAVESDSTGCTTIASHLLPFEYLKPKFNPDITPQTYCVPPNGAIEIPSIRKVPDSTEVFSKYEFKWHVNEYDVNNPDSIKMGEPDGNMLQSLEAGDYYVQALDTFWMVESDPVKAIVDDNTVKPDVRYNTSLSKPQTSCNASTPNGALSVFVIGVDTYDFRWYAGTSPSGSVLSNTNTVTGQPAGNYTVTVTSQTTGCTTVKTYQIVDDIRTPVVAGSTEPVTNCPPILANGIASANIINPNSSYEFYWYEGLNTTGQPFVVDTASNPSIIKVTSVLEKQQPGFYTVVARDTFDCESEAVTIEVEKDVVFPDISVEEISPLTYCDPSKPNAIFSARADGRKNGYTFEWYVKDDTLYNTGADVNNLGNTEYLLIATNDVTGCSSEIPVIPSVAYQNVPNPLVDILQHRTSCIAPDGIANSGINGLLENYAFKYLNFDNADSLEKPQNATEVSELDIESYLVYAKDRTSGCISDTVVFTVDDARYVPDFDVITTPSLCTEPTGEAEVIIADLTRPFEVEWFDEFGSLGTGREILYKPQGDYTAVVEGTDGCTSSQDVTIGTEVIVYNGVSVNGDNLNDVFNIVCLEDFDNNNVKIYNRAGELVFEMDNYNRNDNDKNFTGVANRGPVRGSGRLAIGTYFYVIDKGDGSEQLVGYLELTR